MKNFTRTPNAILDSIADMKPAEMAITFTLVRHLIGYHKHERRISITDLQALTGLSRQGVINGCKAVNERGYFKKEGRMWLVNLVDYQPPASQPSRPAIVNLVDQSSQPSRPMTTGTKKTIKKDKDSSTPPQIDDESNTIANVLESWCIQTGRTIVNGKIEDNQKSVILLLNRINWDEAAAMTLLMEKRQHMLTKDKPFNPWYPSQVVPDIIADLDAKGNDDWRAAFNTVLAQSNGGAFAKLPESLQNVARPIWKEFKDMNSFTRKGLESKFRELYNE
jgi:hypothetical protein